MPRQSKQQVSHSQTTASIPPAAAACEAAAAAESPGQQGAEYSAGAYTAGSQHTSMAADHRQDSTAAEQCQLPQLAVADVAAEVFQLVLEFAYSGSVQILAPRWLKAAGAELLFEAAERYLLPLLKVCCPLNQVW